MNYEGPGFLSQLEIKLFLSKPDPMPVMGKEIRVQIPSSSQQQTQDVTVSTVLLLRGGSVVGCP